MDVLVKVCVSSMDNVVLYCLLLRNQWSCEWNNCYIVYYKKDNADASSNYCFAVEKCSFNGFVCKWCHIDLCEVLLFKGLNLTGVA